MSARNGCLIVPWYPLQPLATESSHWGQGKESRLSLTGRAFTYINLEVQPMMTVICCQAGMLMYGLITVIQHPTNRTLVSSSPVV